MTNNGDTNKVFKVGTDTVRGLGSFHKTLPHPNDFGEVDQVAFEALVKAGEGRGDGYADVPSESANGAPFVNPQAGYAHDRLTPHPSAFEMPPAPTVLSVTTAAEMTELYWMAVLRDVSFSELDARGGAAAQEIGKYFGIAVNDSADIGHLKPGIDVPGSTSAMAPISTQNVFRVGLPGEEYGPMLEPVMNFWGRGNGA